MTTQEYIDKLSTRYKSGITTEHSFRGDLQTLLETIIPDTDITNEPTRIKCGAPDYILTKKGIPVGYIEAKDLAADLNNKNYKEQFTRYKEALPNLIITNYLDFWVYKDGELVSTYSIGVLADGKVIGKPEQYEAFRGQIKSFSDYVGQTIKSASKLAEMMAHKAKILASVIHAALESDEQTTANSTLQEQYKAFKDILIHDITEQGFADIYAQTIAYGMFAARLHDPTLETFTRHEAAELIPKSNPFLRKLFQYIAGYDLDGRIVWIVDALADIFRATDVKALLKNFGKATKQHDPVIHFYETFLSEYDPKLRKSRGVWYTPEPVVNFIVRAVDDILIKEFGLKDGLASTEMTEMEIALQDTDLRKKDNVKTGKVKVHKVQILDPATGTGTFLAEVIRQIHEKFAGQEGIWSKYVEKDLIPRLNGFELLMASYAMAHLKLDMLLTETGYKPKTDQRLRVYLTNSLEEHHPDTGTLFANWLSAEANEANQIKRDVPVMVVLGNPPYSGESANKGEWIMKLMEDYKKEPGGKQKLQEKNSKWINDDYVKFIRFGQSFVEKTGEGVVAYINNHSYLDNPTFRGMRWSLLQTFDKIYILDLHGNSKKNETSPDGSPDKNVFDIQQGVSINLFIKTAEKNQDDLATVYHFDLFGTREQKYNFLLQNSIKSIPFEKLSAKPPMHFLMQKNFRSEEVYNQGFLISNLFVRFGVGICSKRDKIAFQESREDIQTVVQDFYTKSENELKTKYKITTESRDQKVAFAIKNINDFGIKDEYFKQVVYRPFDTRWTYLTNMSKGFIAYPVYDIMHHLFSENIALITNRQCQTAFYQHTFITNKPNDLHITETANANPYTFPLYLYPDGELFNSSKRKPNLNETIISDIAKGLGLAFTSEKEDNHNTFAPIDLFDYIYAVLHSPTYREKYKEFLKIDFPRVSYPTDKGIFWQLVKLGGELRQIHLLESLVVKKYITKYPVDGSNVVDKPIYKDGRVWINTEQYFEGVPEIAWDFYIGGYQPAQKWLKDRKGRELTVEDIQHYQKIIIALSETDRIMKEIDKIEFM